MCRSNQVPPGWLRVTTIIRLAGLMDPRWWDAASAARGTAVHAYLADRLRGGDGGATLDGYGGYREAVDRFLRECRPTPHLIETEVVHHAYGYYGHLDCYATIGSQPVLLDAKTGSAPSWVGLQTAAYALAVADHPAVARPPEAIVRAALVLRPNGDYRLVRLEPYADHADRFLRALVVAKQQVGQCLPEALVHHPALDLTA